MRRLVHAIALIPLGIGLVCGLAQATTSYVEKEILDILDQQAQAYYRTGRFTKVKAKDLLSVEYDYLFKTEARRFSVYALPKKGLVNRRGYPIVLSSYAVVLYFDPARQRLVSAGCQTAGTRRLLIAKPERCGTLGLDKVKSLSRVWPTEAERRSMEAENRVRHVLMVIGIVVYLILFVRYSWVRWATVWTLFCGFMIIGFILQVVGSVRLHDPW